MGGIKECPTCGGKKDRRAKHCVRCSPRQWWAGKRGADHPSWKGGKAIDRDGYVRVYDTQHPWPRSNGYVHEHVRVMEIHIGRRIRPSETVHHRDHDRQNNALDNLELVDRGEHSSRHRKEDIHLRQRDSAGRFASA